MIVGERIRLRAIERSDLPRFVDWLNDPEVIAGLKIFQPLSMAEEEDWYTSMLKRPAVERPLAIELLDEGEWTLIGNLGFFNLDWRIRSAEIGIFIGEKKYWDQGFGTEAMRLALRHAFDTLNLNRVALDVYEDNYRAMRSYEKAGFTLEGRKRKGMFKEGRFIDILQMSILRDEWTV